MTQILPDFIAPEPQPSISPNLPRAVKSYRNKYTDPETQALLQQVPPNVARALQQLDAQRAVKGQNPIPRTQTAKALAAGTGVPATSKATPSMFNVPGNFARDIQAIGTSIPRLPGGLLNEIRALGRVGEEAQKAEGLGGFFDLPGVRLLPGSYIASGLLPGGVPAGDVARHPLFSLLDVLPYGGKVARGIRGTATGARVAEGITRGRQAFGRTRPGQFVAQSFSEQGRAPSRVINLGEQRIAKMLEPGTEAEKLRYATEPGVEATQRAYQVAFEKYPSIDRARRAEITTKLQAGDDLGALSDVEAAFVNETRDLTGQMAKLVEAEGGGLFRGELYDPATLGKFTAREQTIAGARQVSTAIRSLDDLAAVDKKIGTLQRTIGRGNFSAARRYIERNLTAEQRALLPEGLVDNLDAWKTLRKENKRFRKVSDFSERKIGTLEKDLERFAARTPPARFIPRIQQNIVRKIAATEEEIPQVISRLARRDYEALGLTEREFARLADEQIGAWQEMKAAGVNPLFVHKASPERAFAEISSPRVLARLQDPSSIKQRALDFSPAVDDVSIALTHQGMEFLQKRGTEIAVEELQRFGKTGAAIEQELLPTAERIAARTGENTDQVFQRLLKESYEEWNPTEFITWKTPRLANLTKDKLYMPKASYNVMRKMTEPLPTDGWRAMYDPAMNAFRTAVLPLSPRWHFYNIFGGGIMLSAMTDPFTVWKHWSAARKLYKQGEAVSAGQKVQLPEELLLSAKGVTKDIRTFNAAKSKTLARFWQEAGERVPGVKGTRTGFNQLLERSYKANEFFDMQYRTMSYLYGFDKALKKGLSKVEAERVGMDMARRTLQDWAGMTPFERTILRNVFPFYSWMGHVLRFVMKYPVDHPWRASVLANFSAAEMEDWDTGLPERFRQAFFLGEPDDVGNVKAIQVAGMNPFRDLADYFTLGGFLSSVNPFLATAAQQFGVDPQTGGPELYPDLYFDAESGRLRHRATNPVQQLIENTIPQSRLLLGLAQSSSDFKQLMKDNPDAASRLLRSQAGLPVLFRDINVPQERIKTEMARQEAQQRAKAKALKTGVDREAKRYPELVPYLKQMRSLQQAGQTKQFETPREAPPIADIAKRAFIGGFVP